MPSDSKPKRTGRAKKPHPDYPLTPHPSGRWCKKVRGRLHYFGPIDDPDAALSKWLEQKDDLLAGRTPRPKADGMTLTRLVNAFLTFKLSQVDTGELRRSTFAEYHAACAQMLEHFGNHRLVTDITAQEFGELRAKLAEGLKLKALDKRIQLIRSVFKYGYDSALIDRPVRFGQEFKKPSKKALRRERAAQPKRLLTPEQIRALLDVAGPQMKAMILLGINAAFGNTDVSSLPISALDLKAGTVTFPRPKTGAPRRAVLWQETIAAIEAAIAICPTPKDEADAGLVFITKYGRRWVRYRPPSPRSEYGCWVNSVGLEFGKVMDKAKLTLPGVGFYSLRHTYRTVVDALPDRAAIDLTMGHVEADGDMRQHYVESLEDARLRKLTAHVHKWLFGRQK